MQFSESMATGPHIERTVSHAPWRRDGLEWLALIPIAPAVLPRDKLPLWLWVSKTTLSNRYAMRSFPLRVV
jgi:hypothetical protein